MQNERISGLWRFWGEHRRCCGDATTSNPGSPVVVARLRLWRGVWAACLVGGILQAVVVSAQEGTYDWSAATQLYPGLEYAAFGVSEPRTLQVRALRVDLQEPSIRFSTTGRDPLWGEPMPDFPDYTVRTRRQRTRDFITSERNAGRDMIAAINASPWRPFSECRTCDYAENMGLLISDGDLVNDTPRRASINFDWDWRPSMGEFSAGDDVANFYVAVSGFVFVLRDNVPEGSDNKETGLAPRTGTGVCADERYVYLITIDGRQSGWSDGVTRYETGEWLRYFGAATGIVMDGGGSTTMYTVGANGSLDRRNRPSDGLPPLWISERYVGTNLGVYRDTRPPAVARYPATLTVDAPRDEEVTLAFDVINEGGLVLSYTMSSDADWLVVPETVQQVKGQRPQEIVLDTRGLPGGEYEAVVTLVNQDNPSDTEALTVTLEVLPGPGDLPIIESFEAWELDTALEGHDGWVVSNASAAQVVEESYSAAIPPGFPLPEEPHTRVATFAGQLSRGVSALDGAAVKVDVMVRFRPGELDVSRIPPETQAALQLDPAGQLHLWHQHHDGNGWTPRWTALGYSVDPEQPWFRISVDTDYATNPDGDTFVRPRIAGSMRPTAYGYRAPDDLTTPGPWYMTANSPGVAGGSGAKRLAGFAFKGQGAFDDLVIRNAVEANALYPDWMGFAHTGPDEVDGIPLNWFDKWGIHRNPDHTPAGDGRTAEKAFWTGTSPIAAGQDFRVVRVWQDDGQIHVEFRGNDSGAAAPFVMRRTLDLTDPAGWEVIDPAVARAHAPAPTTIWSYDHAGDNGPAYFYRPEVVRE